MGPKKSDPLPTTFTCLFCNHEKSVTVKLDKKAGIGQLDCRVCGQTFQCAVNYLSAAVDVYGEWVDAADTVAKEDNTQAAYAGTAKTSGPRKALNSKVTAEEEDDERLYEGEGIAADD